MLLMHIIMFLLNIILLLLTKILLLLHIIMLLLNITKTYLYNFDPLEPHFYIVKLGFTGVYIISSPGLCPWRAYVVTQALASASVGVHVGVRVSTMFKFSNVCIVFLMFKVLLSYLAYTYFRVRPFNNIHSLPKIDSLCRSRSVLTFVFYTHV